MNIEYRSITDLNNAILSNLYKFPHDIDLIVGIPRSGMLPANLLALYLNKPYTDINSFVEGRIYATGERGKNINVDVQKVLVVDDSIYAGTALNKAKTLLSKIGNQYLIQFAVVYATTHGSSLVDYYCEIIDDRRVFQWNFFHHSIITQSCLDIDGVLCLDPPIDDDGPLYLDYIKNAIPLYLPTVKIGALVTCRLEKYRDATETWLHKQGIQYGELIMLDKKTKSERIAWGRHGEFKAEVFTNTNYLMFVESSLSQAQIISNQSNKPVFCTEIFSFVLPKVNLDLWSIFKKKIHNLLWLLRHK